MIYKLGANSWQKRVVICIIMSKWVNHSRGIGSIRQTERRDLPHLLALHLWCVCIFLNNQSHHRANAGICYAPALQHFKILVYYSVADL